jgi:ribosome-associated translation inhibitor RaiA
MQVILHSDPNTDGSQPMADHVKTVVMNAVERFGERITGVDAHLSHVSSHATASPDDIHCAMEARLAGLEPVIVKDHAGSAHQAIEGAARKLKRAVGAALAKTDPRGHRARAAVTAAETAVEPPD